MEFEREYLKVQETIEKQIDDEENKDSSNSEIVKTLKEISETKKREVEQLNKMNKNLTMLIGVLKRMH